VVRWLLELYFRRLRLSLLFSIAHDCSPFTLVWMASMCLEFSTADAFSLQNKRAPQGVQLPGDPACGCDGSRPDDGHMCVELLGQSHWYPFEHDLRAGQFLCANHSLFQETKHCVASDDAVVERHALPQLGCVTM